MAPTKLQNWPCRFLIANEKCKFWLRNCCEASRKIRRGLFSPSPSLQITRSTDTSARSAMTNAAQSYASGTRKSTEKMNTGALPMTREGPKGNPFLIWRGGYTRD